MSIIVNNFDDHLTISSVDDTNKIDHIPAHVYRISISPSGIVLSKDRKSFKTPSVIFGNCMKYRDVIINDWKQRKDRSTGVLLSGTKGAGKSMMSEIIANYLLAMDIPVFLITSNISKSLLSTVAKIAGPSLFIFDEFEKNFPEESDEKTSQQDLLSFFSDTDLNGAMFILTINSLDNLSYFIKDRPQRIKYHIRHNSSDETVFQDICKHYDIHEGWKRMIVALALSEGNIDMTANVAQILKESNTVSEFNERIKILNFFYRVVFQFRPNYSDDKPLIVNGVKHTGSVSRLGKVLDANKNVLVEGFVDRHEASLHFEKEILPIIKCDRCTAESSTVLEINDVFHHIVVKVTPGHGFNITEMLSNLEIAHMVGGVEVPVNEYAKAVEGTLSEETANELNKELEKIKEPSMPGFNAPLTALPPYQQMYQRVNRDDR